MSFKFAKWTKDGEGINVGTIVLIKEKNLLCLPWAESWILVHSGEDGVVRTVTVKMNAGIIKTIGKMSMFTSN